MARKKHKPDEIIRKLRDAESMLNQGQSMAQVIQKLEVTEQTYYRWKSEFGGMRGEQMKLLKELQEENRKLKRLVADQALDLACAKEVIRGKW